MLGELGEHRVQALAGQQFGLVGALLAALDQARLAAVTVDLLQVLERLEDGHAGHAGQGVSRPLEHGLSVGELGHLADLPGAGNPALVLVPLQCEKAHRAGLLSGK